MTRAQEMKARVELAEETCSRIICERDDLAEQLRDAQAVIRYLERIRDLQRRMIEDRDEQLRSLERQRP